MSLAQRALAILLLTLASQAPALAQPATPATQPAPAALPPPTLLSQLARTGTPPSDRSLLAPLFSQVLDLPDAPSLDPDRRARLAMALVDCGDLANARRALASFPDKSSIGGEFDHVSWRLLLIALLAEDHPRVESLSKNLAAMEQQGTSFDNDGAFDRLACLILLGREADAIHLMDLRLARERSNVTDRDVCAAYNFLASRALLKNNRSAAMAYWKTALEKLQPGKGFTTQSGVSVSYIPIVEGFPPFDTHYDNINEACRWVGPRFMPLALAPAQIAALELADPQRSVVAVRDLLTAAPGAQPPNGGFLPYFIQTLLHDQRALDVARTLHALDAAKPPLLVDSAFAYAKSDFASSGQLTASRISELRFSNPTLRMVADLYLGPYLASCPGGISRDALLDRLRTAIDHKPLRDLPLQVTPVATARAQLQLAAPQAAAESLAALPEATLVNDLDALELVARLEHDTQFRALAAKPAFFSRDQLIRRLLDFGLNDQASHLLEEPASAKVRNTISPYDALTFYIRAGNIPAARKALALLPRPGVRLAVKAAIGDGRFDFARELLAHDPDTRNFDTEGYASYFDAGFSLNPRSTPFHPDATMNPMHIANAFCLEVRCGDPALALTACQQLTDPAARLYAALGIARAAVSDPSPGFVLPPTFDLGARDLVITFPPAADLDVELDRGNITLATRSLSIDRLQGKPLTLNGRNWFPVWKPGNPGSRTMPFPLHAAHLGWTLHSATTSPPDPKTPPQPLTATQSTHQDVFTFHITRRDPAAVPLRIHLSNTLRDPALQSAAPATQPTTAR